MTGQDSVVQWAVIVPYSILIWLKKSTAVCMREGEGEVSRCVCVRVWGKCQGVYA